MYHPLFLAKAHESCKKHGILFIADEIAVGFGRTGKFFAMEHAGVSPDMMCLSKGITGGFLPLSVVLTTQELYEAFYAPYGEMKGFLHSHSYTGNPLACAAANAVLDLFEESDVMALIAQKGEWLHDALTPIGALGCVKEIRQMGLIAAIELQGFTFEERVGVKIFRHALSLGVLVRPLGNVVYMMPPYVITKEEIAMMVDAVHESLKQVDHR